MPRLDDMLLKWPVSCVQDAEYHLTKEVKDIYPDFVKMAESFSVPAKRVLRPEELRPAIRYELAQAQMTGAVAVCVLGTSRLCHSTRCQTTSMQRCTSLHSEAVCLSVLGVSFEVSGRLDKNCVAAATCALF